MADMSQFTKWYAWPYQLLQGKQAALGSMLFEVRGRSSTQVLTEGSLVLVQLHQHTPQNILSLDRHYSGRGTCRYGECACDMPYYGVDCSLREGTIHPPLPTHIDSKQLTTTAVPLGRAQGGARAGPDVIRDALRPRIYVYEMPPLYNVTTRTR